MKTVRRVLTADRAVHARHLEATLFPVATQITEDLRDHAGVPLHSLRRQHGHFGITNREPAPCDSPHED